MPSRALSAGISGSTAADPSSSKAGGTAGRLANEADATATFSFAVRSPSRASRPDDPLGLVLARPINVAGDQGTDRPRDRPQRLCDAGWICRRNTRRRQNEAREQPATEGARKAPTMPPQNRSGTRTARCQNAIATMTQTRTLIRHGDGHWRPSRPGCVARPGVAPMQLRTSCTRPLRRAGAPDSEDSARPRRPWSISFAKVPFMPPRLDCWQALEGGWCGAGRPCIKHPTLTRNDSEERPPKARHTLHYRLSYDAATSGPDGGGLFPSICFPPSVSLYGFR